MNKQEKLIAGLLGLMLVGWLFYSQTQQAKQAKIVAQQQAEARQQAVAASNNVAQTAVAPLPAPVLAAPSAPAVELLKPAAPE